MIYYYLIMIDKDDIRINYNRLIERVENACNRVKRKPEDITIVAVTKTLPPAIIRAGYEAGIRIFGENKVQETERKWGELMDIKDKLTLHLIGHLQRNKVRDAIYLYDVIESIDSERLALELDKRIRKSEVKSPFPVLIEVNTSGEETKYGTSPDRAIDLIEKIIQLPTLSIIGLMTVGPLTTDEKRTRGAFSLLRELGERAQKIVKPEQVFHLSMGMTDDFEIAIEEGSTMIRIGRAIFGERYE